MEGENFEMVLYVFNSNISIVVTLLAQLKNCYFASTSGTIERATLMIQTESVITEKCLAGGPRQTVVVLAD